MIYQMECASCGEVDISKPMSHPAKDGDQCPECMGFDTRRIFAMPQICTSGCSGASDPDDVPAEFGGTQDPLSGARTANVALEKAYQRDIEHKRRNKTRGGSRQIKRSVPAELYHGKIKQTGDKNYWDDPKNRRRHPSTKI